MADDKKQDGEAVEDKAKAQEKKAGVVPFSPKKTGKKAPEKKPVEAFAAAADLPPWKLAALRQAAGWKPGKEVSAEEFTAAVQALDSRRQGGGKLAGGR